MEVTKNILEKFIYDYKLPIPIAEEPYFSYYLDLYDKDYDTKKKYKLFLEAVERFETENEFFDYMQEVRLMMINTIKLSDAYKRFNDERNFDFVVDKKQNPNPKFLPTPSVRNVNFSKRTDVYMLENVNKCYLSIDLKKANFQVLKKYDERIVSGAKSYDEFIRKFTDSEYIIQSKNFRETVFGFLNMGRIALMERYYVGKIIEWLLDNNLFKAEEMIIYTNDELVILLDDILSPEECKNIKDRIQKEIKLEVSAESFCLKSIGNKKYFVKEDSTGEKVFKAIPAAYFPQAYKKYYGKDIEDIDLCFLFEHNIAKFEKSIFD